MGIMDDSYDEGEVSSKITERNPNMGTVTSVLAQRNSDVSQRLNSEYRFPPRGDSTGARKCFVSVLVLKV